MKEGTVRKKNKTAGSGSIIFQDPAIICSRASVVGKKEGEGPLGRLFDYVGEDDLFGAYTWEEAESKLQEKAIALCIEKSGLRQEEVRYLFAGDLLGQSIASSFGTEGFHRPVLGVYGACSTSALGMILAALMVSSGAADYAMNVTSSHFASAEKEFRFPLEYGNQRPLSATWTVTGSAAFLLGHQGTGIKVTAATPGKIVDYGIKDSMNMGAAMAPAAANTILRHMKDFDSGKEEYDKIITGDLGYVGQEILLKLLKEHGIDISDRHTDCGIEIFDQKTQDTHSGGSGCGCAATVLSSYILKKMEEGEWKKVLFIPTGALLSKVSFNEGKSIPGIAHAVVLESE